jgi:ABC-type Fe3+-hydroxamate transport system substrate-binding protein
LAYFKDQLNERIELKEAPRRIISLVPSQTELLYDLALENEVIGITKFCIHPPNWFQTKERVGGTKQLNIEKIKSLQPDLIIGNKEENVKEQIEALQSIAPVWMSDVNDLDTAIDMIDQVGIMTKRIPQAQMIIHKILEAQCDLPTTKKKVLYFIWNEPMMVAGKHTFIDAMLSEAGFVNAVTENRYPELSAQQIEKLNPELLFLSSEPFPFNGEQQKIYQEKFPKAKVLLVNGELFSWYGSRLVQSFEYFRTLNEQHQG